MVVVGPDIVLVSDCMSVSVKITNYLCVCVCVFVGEYVWLILTLVFLNALALLSLPSLDMCVYFWSVCLSLCLLCV